MPSAKLLTSRKHQPMHLSVGALIQRDDEILLIDRVKPPFGFAGIAGHVDDGEDVIDALKREIQEESGLYLTKHTLLFEEELDWNECSKGVGTHYWYLFECEVEGEQKRNREETKSIGWVAIEELQDLSLEPVWKYWLAKVGILNC